MLVKKINLPRVKIIEKKYPRPVKTVEFFLVASQFFSLNKSIIRDIFTHIEYNVRSQDYAPLPVQHTK